MARAIVCIWTSGKVEIKSVSTKAFQSFIEIYLLKNLAAPTAGFLFVFLGFGSCLAAFPVRPLQINTCIAESGVVRVPLPEVAKYWLRG